MLTVKMYSVKNKERGKVKCEDIAIGIGYYTLSNVEEVDGAVDIINIYHHYGEDVSFDIDFSDIVSVQSA